MLINQKKALSILCVFLLIMGLIGLFYDFENIYIDMIFSNLFLEFLLGIIVYFIYTKFHFVLIEWQKNIFFILTLMLFFLVSFGVDYGYEVIGVPMESVIISFGDYYTKIPRSIIWGIPSFLLVFSTLFFFENKKPIKFLEFFGNISYSLYLVQVPFVFMYLKIIAHTKNTYLLTLEIILTFILIILFSMFTYKFIEKEYWRSIIRFRGKKNKIL